MASTEPIEEAQGRARLWLGAAACSLVAPIVAQGLTRVLAAWTGAPFEAISVGAAATAPVLVAAALALVRGSARPIDVAVAGVAGALVALGLGPAALVLVAALLGALVATALPRVAASVPLPRGRVAALLWGLVAVLAVAQLWRMHVFMADPTQRWGAFAPDKFVYEHNCLSSYVHGAALARRGDANIYDDRYAFEESEQTPELPSAIDVRPLTMDSYEYPPLFLPLPRLLLAVTGDFLAIRALWFLLTAAAFVAAVVGLARWLGGDATRRAGLLAVPLALAPAALITAYTGNFQLTALGFAALAMAWIVSGRTRSGAALLAFMIGAKIFPGLLAVWLLASRRYAALAWTAAFGALYALLALVVVGARPFVDFFSYHLPRLASGETFAFLTQPRAIASNLGPFGTPFKLHALGLLSEADAWALARPLAWAFTLLAVVVALVAGRRAGGADGPRARALLAASWFGLLALGALRSPFAPPGLLVALIWGLSLRAAAAETRRDSVRAGALWVLVLLVIPAPTPVGIAVSLVAQVFVVALALQMALARPHA